MPDDVIQALNAELTANGAVQTLLRKYPELYDSAFVPATERGAAIKKQLGQE